MNSKTKIARLSYEKARATISIDLAANDVLRGFLVDGTRRHGTWVGTIDGWLWRDAWDGLFGIPNLGFADHEIIVRRAPVSDPKATTNLRGGIFVPDPPSTFGLGPITAQEILGHLWDVGFHDETNLMGALAIAAGESGWYPQARNWLPSTGFRHPGDQIGVQGPAAAWNRDHSLQGHSDRGLFQINSEAWPAIPDSECDDPAQACAAIFLMSHAGSDWSPWGFGEGLAHYEPWYDGKVNGLGPLRPIVTAFLAAK